MGLRHTREMSFSPSLSLKLSLSLSLSNAQITRDPDKLKFNLKELLQAFCYGREIGGTWSDGREPLRRPSTADFSDKPFAGDPITRRTHQSDSALRSFYQSRPFFFFSGPGHQERPQASQDCPRTQLCRFLLSS